ncbi:MAG: cyclopropane-fatty-acyl-phospholipid synthase family protein [Armatimonadota bacterium]|nr:cyclopropane-fatty-acyl-phospholipid synthase family protein [Armatimonadota bacterium]MDR7452123.1 cyclopropane-fatty-acyl-phospholipid synthase family protein [Armatimonadota bacterium]MDR7467847.1 cyclopropane-fatty-acyl-phospholipid synthase family protein [Armatimonadota bacterium]MDR7494735.1 cyclopropane-fatty-acyl-phospholipid synthase family protein [Armatimonadota bacterium]MDR7499560.1 cyclopropane-fatty-acyl-phospholipid synthase family protein [Armatimonadota bacterium]
MALSRTRPVVGEERAVRLTLQILGRLFAPREFPVRLWTGATLPADHPAEGREARFTLVLAHPGALRRMLLPPTDLTLGEAYVRGDFEIEGSLEDAVAAAVNATSTRPVVDWLAAAAMARLLPDTAASGTIPPRARLRGRRHSQHRDAVAVRHHYDLGNDFFALWLDRRMVYSCAYFPTGTETLDAAQEAKLEHICRKLRLRPGERLLDIGCGWGGLVLYAAKRYHVQAVGVTLSEPQARYGQARLAAAGLTQRAEIRVCDYRQVRDPPFDKLVSIGMFEHVGRRHLPEYFRCAWNALRPGGLFLNHGITGRPRPSVWKRFGPGRSFMQAHIFPDGELEPVSESLRAAEAVGFEVRDVENLREHYARTLRLWLANLEAHRDRAEALIGRGRYRLWRLYLAASAQGFTAGRTGVCQALLARPDASGTVTLPWSRGDLYTR